MKGYLGETIINIKDTPYKNFKPVNWVMYYIEEYSQIDGSHHKQWVLDQVARILNGTEVIVRLAEWEGGKSEYHVNLDEPSEEYLRWRQNRMFDEEENDFTYDYDEGTPP